AFAGAVGSNVVSHERVRPLAARRVVGDVKCFFVRRNRDAVGHGHIVDDARHLVRDWFSLVGVDAIDGKFLLPILRLAAIARIGEPDAALAIDAEIVGRRQSFAVMAIGEHSDRAVLLVAMDRAGAVLAAAGDQAAPGIHAHAVGVLALVVPDFDLAI